MGFRGRSGVTANDLQKYRTTVPGVRDGIFAPLFDYQTYDAAAAPALFTFFTVPIGQGTTSAPGGTGPKTFLDTNMQVSGQLPRGNTFICIGIEVEFWPGNTPGLNSTTLTAAQFARNCDDVYTIYRNAALTLTVQNRIYVQDGPLMKFPTQSRLAGFASYSETTATTAGQIEYAAACGAAYDITPVKLESTQAFNVQIQFPAVTALPSGTAGRIGVRLVGKMVRDAQ